MRRSRAKLVLAAEDGKPTAEQAAAAPARTAEIIEFQPDAAELEERQPPFVARATLYLVALVIAAAVGWASVAKMDEIVTARGKLVTTAPSIVVQPFETSVIRALDVKVGDVVKAGQPLATLDPTIPGADRDQLRGKLASLDAQIARLEAELDTRDYAPGQGASADQALQARVFAQRRDYYAAKVRDFDTQIAKTEATYLGSLAEAAVLRRRLSGQNEVVAMNAELIKRGAGSQLAYLQSQDTSLDTEAAIGRAESAAKAATAAMDQLAADREAFVQDFRRETTEKLVDLRGQRAAAAEELKKADLRAEMAVLRAPADGAVLDIAQRSAGSVVNAAEPLVTLVPLDVPLEAEVAVAGRDIGRLALSDTARIKFDAFPFQKYGTMQGRVRVISEDAFAADSRSNSTPAAGRAPDAASFYRLRLSLGAPTLRDLPAGFQLIPGMGVQAEIKTGRRSVLSYFLYPFLRGLDESFREP